MVNAAGLHVFDAALGACGIAWTERGIVGLQLPEHSRQATLRRLSQRFPELKETALSDEVSAAVLAIAALLDGDNPDLDFINLDLRAVPEFNQRVYAIARAIPRGQTFTYGHIARQLGDVALSRAVGRALGANPFPIVVPCHRVLAASGLGGFSAHGGAATKRRLLSMEGTPGVQLSMFDS